MTLELALWAKDSVSARDAAMEWARAEPNVERCEVVDATPKRDGWRYDGFDSTWHVTVHLTLREAEALTLGLTA